MKPPILSKALNSLSNTPNKHPEIAGIFISVILFGVFLLYAKVDFLTKHWYLIAKHFGVILPSEVPFLSRALFLAQDVACAFIVVPIATILIVGLIPRAFRLRIYLPAVLLATIFVFYQMQAYNDSGSYLTADLLVDGIRFFIGSPEVAKEYINPTKVLKLIIFLFAIVVASFFWLWVSKYRKFQQSYCYAKIILAINCFSLIMLAIGAIALVASISTPNKTKLHKSALQTIVNITFENNDVLNYSKYSKLEILNFSDEDSGIEAEKKECGNLSEYNKNNIILFVMETAPTQVFDWDKQKEKHHYLKLFDASAVKSSSHFTTYPYTSDALFSILSGMYPMSRRNLLRHVEDNTQIPSLFVSLKQYNYNTAVFSPSMYEAELDEKMFKVFGADEVFIANKDNESETLRVDANKIAKALSQNKLTPEKYDVVAGVLKLDLIALEKLKLFMSTQAKQKKQFAALYLPQTGHAPWPAVVESDNLHERGQALIDIQLEWLNDLMAELDQLGLLDSTTIVLTGDHGIRTRVEDPSLPVGQLTSYSFQVPLLMYVGGNKITSSKLSSPTSHIDIMPSLLASLGINDWQHNGQGLPMWCRTDNHRIYFFARAYGGVDGYLQNNYFTMIQNLTGQSYYQKDTMNFSLPTKVTLNKAESNIASSRVNYQEGLQFSLSQKLITESKAKK